MIYTVTLSPALDYLVWIDHFEPGGLNRTNQTAFRAGGKGINVSVVLSRLGYQSICLGFTAGFVGSELIRLLDNENIKHNFIHTENGCSRINVKIKSDTESEINAYGPQVSEEEIQKLMSKISDLQKGDVLIFSGNPPKNLPADIYSRLIDAVPADVNIIVDTSGAHLLSALANRPFLIKPNKAELEEICGKKLDSMGKIALAAVELREQGAKNVLVSLGAEGGLLAADDGQVYTCAIPSGKLIDSTGAGDSMVAGFTAKNLCRADRAECLRFAVACGCASTYSYGLLDAKKLEEVYARTPHPSQCKLFD